MFRLAFSIVAGLCFSASVLVPSLQAEAPEKPVVYVPIPPYEYLFDRIAGDLIDTRTIVGPHDDPHTYSPTPRQVAELAKANLIFVGDLGFEGNFFVKLGDGITAPRSINLLDGIALLDGSCSICEEIAAAKAAGEESSLRAHSHTDLKDPHVWLSPKILLQQTDRVATILKAHLPETAAKTIEANVASLKQDLQALDEEITLALAPMQGERFYVYHGAFAYFSQDYGVKQAAIEIGNRQPTPKQLTDIVHQAQRDEVKVVLVQPQFDQTSADALAQAIGGKVVPMDTLERDVIANLRRLVALIVSAHAG